MKHGLTICGWIIVALTAAGTLGQNVQVLAVRNDQKDNWPKVVRMTIHPAAEPRPALKYKLLPGFWERRSGNAAVIYNRIWMDKFEQEQYLREHLEEIASWLDMPLDKLPREKVQQVVEMTNFIYRDFQWASRLDSCDWERPLREENPISILVPEIREIRHCARLLALRARWQMAQGRFDDAVDTLRVGYALGRNVAKDPLVISSLVGMAICSHMSTQVETMIQQPDCPNLYWALTNLPEPIIDPRNSFEAESELFYLMFPELRDVDDAIRNPGYWRDFLHRASEQISAIDGSVSPNQDANDIAFLGMAMAGYPRAKRALIEQGRPPAEVEAMPMAQVVIVYSIEVFNELRDDVFKWLSLPYWQAEPGASLAWRRIANRDESPEIIPIARMLLPALHAVKISEARTSRQIALLRTIEALRLHAATHDGRLPATLDELDVPVPIDPFTGKPIECRIKGDVAVLEDLRRGPNERTKDGRIIEIRVAK